MTNSSKKFSSPYDGFIGISPGMNPSTGAFENSDFILDLMRKGMIDHPVVSVYTQNGFGNSSIIKFGGWDEEGMGEGETL